MTALLILMGIGLVMVLAGRPEGPVATTGAVLTVAALMAVPMTYLFGLPL